MRTASEYMERAEEVLLHTYNRFPVVLDRGEGVYLYDMEGKKYYNHSQYRGGLRTRTARTMKEKYTVEWVELAIQGMLPHTRLGDQQRRHLFVYTGAEHPHAAQKPVVMEIKG